jgi:uncharacterized protein (TIGR00255 family)
MTLSSMTGFARASGAHEGVHWQWEIKSVNGKALDVRCRLPSGLEHLEGPIREAAQRRLKRGTLQIALATDRGTQAQKLAINESGLEQVLSLVESLRRRFHSSEPPRIEGLLALRGIIDVVAVTEDPNVAKTRDEAMLASLDDALNFLVQVRQAEGGRLRDVVEAQIQRIEGLTSAARDCPARSPDAIRGKLSEQIQRLLEANRSFDEDRLHQEAILLATRADIQEEIDRLFAHIDAARGLLSAGDSAGRKLEFLAQEFNREANTLCSKASDRTLTEIGLELKAVIDQMREQVQNIE